MESDDGETLLVHIQSMEIGRIYMKYSMMPPHPLQAKQALIT